MDITVTKRWDDASDKDKKRPASITIVLLADGKEIRRQTVDSVKSGNEQTIVFASTEEDPLYTYKDGVKIIYSVSELPVEDYTTEITDAEKPGDPFIITNTHTPEVMDIAVTKRWDDASDKDGKRPASITVILLADDKEIRRQTIDSVKSEDEQKIVFAGTDRGHG